MRALPPLPRTPDLEAGPTTIVALRLGPAPRLNGHMMIGPYVTRGARVLAVVAIGVAWGFGAATVVGGAGHSHVAANSISSSPTPTAAEPSPTPAATPPSIISQPVPLTVTPVSDDPAGDDHGRG